MNIICPECKKSIALDEALTHQLQEDIKSKLSEQSTQEIEEIRRKSLEWKAEYQKEIEAERKADLEKLEIQTKRLEEKIRQEQSVNNEALKKELEEKSQKLLEAEKLELELRQQKNAIEEEKRRFELEKQRQLDTERDKIRQETANSLLEQHRLQDQEKLKQIEDMRKKIEELQLKANITSQQLQGEILELELEQLLRTEFAVDDIAPVGKGVNGADILQTVRNMQGQDCGIIIWESKRTKNWTEGWVSKLKEDLRSSKADVAVLVTTALPSDIKNFGPKDGIYVTNFECVVSLAKFIRLSLMQLQMTKTSVVGKNEKMEMIYNYLSGNQFRQRVEAIQEAFTSMRKDLDDERKVYTKLWAKREKEIDRVINNTLGMHGDLQGLMGPSLPEIETTSIQSLLPDTDESDRIGY